MSCRVQVKSRWATDHDGGLPMREFNSDFAVFVSLNRGYRYGRKVSLEDAGVQPPAFHVVPTEIARAARSEKSTWGKVFLRSMEEPTQYLDNWSLIRDCLRFPVPL